MEPARHIWTRVSYWLLFVIAPTVAAFLLLGGSVNSGATCCRHPHGESGASAQLTGHANTATVGFDDGFADSQAQAAVAATTGARSVGTIKALKNVRNIFRGDALPGVEHSENSVAVFCAGANANFTIWLVVVNSVSQQVGDHLPNALAVSEHFGRREIAMDLDAVP